MKEENIFNIRLLREIEKYPYLYNYNLTEYTSREITEKAWNEIGEKFKKTPDECKARWKNLRGSLTRNLSQRLKPAGKVPKTFYLTRYMQFVLPFAKSRQKTYSMNGVNKITMEAYIYFKVPCVGVGDKRSITSVYIQDDDREDEEQSEDNLIIDTNADPFSSKKRKLLSLTNSTGIDYDFKNKLILETQADQEKESIAEDDKRCLKFIADELKKVPDDLKLQVKAEILNLIRKAQSHEFHEASTDLPRKFTSLQQSNFSNQFPHGSFPTTENLPYQSGYTYESLSAENADEGNQFESNLEDSNREDASKDSWNSIEVKEGIELFDENFEECNEPSSTLQKTSLNKSNPVATTSTATVVVKDPLDTRVDQPPASDNDADKHFLLSLLPHLHGLTPTEKLQFQIKTLNVINEIMSAREKV